VCEGLTGGTRKLVLLVQVQRILLAVMEWGDLQKETPGLESRVGSDIQGKEGISSGGWGEQASEVGMRR
jgi:hypothetical protein